MYNPLYHLNDFYSAAALFAMQSAVLSTAIPSVFCLSVCPSHAGIVPRRMKIGSCGHKITRRRKDGHGRGLGELPKIWGFLFNIYTTAEASNFKFGTQLGFAKAHHKITPRGKSWHGLGLGEFPKILRFHFNVYTMAEARDFKFGTQLEFAKAHHQTTPIGKVSVALG